MQDCDTHAEGDLSTLPVGGGPMVALEKAIALPMADRMQQERIEELDKETDAFVWSVVRYLDSPTDYREYLPYPHRPSSLQDSDLVLLDNIPRYVYAWLWSVTLSAIVVCVIVLAVLRS